MVKWSSLVLLKQRAITKFLNAVSVKLIDTHCHLMTVYYEHIMNISNVKI